MSMPSTTNSQLEDVMKLESANNHCHTVSPDCERSRESETSDSMRLSPPTEQHEKHNLQIVKKEPGTESTCSNLTSTAPPVSKHWVPASYFNHASDIPTCCSDLPTCNSGGVRSSEEQRFFNNTALASTTSGTSSAVATGPYNHAITGQPLTTIPPKMSGRRKPRNTFMARGRKAWGNEEKRRMEMIIEQRSKEWKARQAMWKSGFSSYHRGYSPPSCFTTPRSPAEVMSYNYEASHYPTLTEEVYYSGGRDFDQEMSPVIVDQRVTSKPVERGGGTNQPVIQQVVSLAGARESNETKPSGPTTRQKRPRKILDEQESSDSGTSEADDSHHSGKYISDLARPFVNIPDDHQVAHINGLLSLPSNRETRYGITYGELKRRCNPPESLTRVDLVAYVRHSKSSGRSLLDKYNIVSANRNSRPTVLSKMCENEARVLGDGILKMNSEFFPGRVLAQTVSKKLKAQIKMENENDVAQTKVAVKEKMNEIEITRSMLKEVYDLLLSEKDTEEMKTFELASHTFGTANLMNHLTLFDRFFEDYQTFLSSKK